MARQPLIKINGVAFPQPAYGVTYATQQFVNDARVASGQLVSQVVGRRILKLDSLVWNAIDYDTWRVIRSALDGFSADVTYWDDLADASITRSFYFGNSTATPYKFEETESGVLKPTHYKECKVNIIDKGE